MALPFEWLTVLDQTSWYSHHLPVFVFQAMYMAYMNIFLQKLITQLAADMTCSLILCDNSYVIHNFILYPLQVFKKLYKLKCDIT